MENNNQRVLTIVIVATALILVIIFAGVTYAFFTANNPKGSTAEIKSETGRMLITYNDGTDNIVPVTNIQPSNTILVNKTFTLTGSNTTSGLAMPYNVGLKYTSTFSNGMIHYYIKEVNRKSDSQVTVNYKGTIGTTILGNSTYTGYSHGTLKNGDRYIDLVTGEYPANTSNQTVTFNLIIQFPDNNKNQDIEKGKSINGKIVINHSTNFSDHSWNEIAENIKSGNTSIYKVGEEKEITINGKNYDVRIANNSTSSECNDTDFSETACGFVVEFVDIVENRQMNNTDTNVGGWPASELRTYANGDFFNSLPSDLQDVIIDTEVISGHGNASGETNFTSTDKIYLLSAHEVWNGDGTYLSTYDTAYSNTRQLDYYKNKGITTSNYLGAIKQYNSFNFYWWLRTADSDITGSFWIVDDDGGDGAYFATDLYGLAPAFRIG